jgi:hypothetical protein
MQLIAVLDWQLPIRGNSTAASFPFTVGKRPPREMEAPPETTDRAGPHSMVRHLFCVNDVNHWTKNGSSRFLDASYQRLKPNNHSDVVGYKYHVMISKGTQLIVICMCINLNE